MSVKTLTPRTLTVAKLRAGSASNQPGWQEQISSDHGNHYDLKPDNSDFMATRLLKMMTGSLTDLEKALVVAQYTSCMDEANPADATHCLMVDANPTTENMEHWGNVLEHAGFQKTAGVQGYLKYCSKMAVFMALCTLDHLADMVRNVEQSKKMAAVGGFTPMKPFLMALAAHAPDVNEAGNFLRTTAEIIHRMAFFHQPDPSKDNAIYETMITAYELNYDHPDRTVSATKKLKNITDVYDALPEEAKRIAESLESSKSRLFGLKNFTPVEQRNLTALRRLNAVFANNKDPEKKEKQFRSLTGDFEKAAKIAYEGETSSANNFFTF